MLLRLYFENPQHIPPSIYSKFQLQFVLNFCNNKILLNFPSFFLCFSISLLSNSNIIQKKPTFCAIEMSANFSWCVLPANQIWNWNHLRFGSVSHNLTLQQQKSRGKKKCRKYFYPSCVSWFAYTFHFAHVEAFFLAFGHDTSENTPSNSHWHIKYKTLILNSQNWGHETCLPCCFLCWNLQL